MTEEFIYGGLSQTKRTQLACYEFERLARVLMSDEARAKRVLLFEKAIPDETRRGGQEMIGAPRPRRRFRSARRRFPTQHLGFMITLQPMQHLPGYISAASVMPSFWNTSMPRHSFGKYQHALLYASNHPHPHLLIVPPHPASETSLPASIVGCKEVSCPYDTYDTCIVANNTFAGIGLARIANVPSSLEGLSIVKGAGITDIDPPAASVVPETQSYGNRPYLSAYYLGIPPDISLKNLTGCAITFDDPAARNFSVASHGNATAEKTKSATGGVQWYF